MNRIRHWGVIAVCLAGCSTQVVVPASPTEDEAPTVTIGALAIPPQAGPVGDIEPGKENNTASTNVKVSRGMILMFFGSASNPKGGVQTFEMVVAQNGSNAFDVTTSSVRDSNNSAPDLLALPGAGPHFNQPMKMVADSAISVTGTSTNFNGQSTTVKVTYIPTDLTVTLVANPSTIGYGTNASSSTLAWSSLYGGDQTLKMTPSIPGIDPLETTGTIAVAPNATTTYTFTAQDAHSTQSASATVVVALPPPPPTIQSFNAAPNDGYNCLGTMDTLTWSVTNCSASCNVVLSAKGYGYASSFSLYQPNEALNGSYSINPGDEIDFTLTASSQFGSVSKDKNLYIADPKWCGH